MEGVLTFIFLYRKIVIIKNYEEFLEKIFAFNANYLWNSTNFIKKYFEDW